MLTLYIRRLRNEQGIADYEYVVMVNAEKIAAGEVIGHRRDDGWAPLVKRIAEQNEEK